MTENALHGRALARRLGHIGPQSTAVLASMVSAVAFAAIQPPVNDLWAARSRADAAQAGVGLHYWFSWFSGVVPGNYSVLLPWLYRAIDPVAVATICIPAGVALVAALVRESRHPVAATWIATLTFSACLWSGRVTFIAGTTVMVAALIAVRARRPVLAAIGGAACALTSPVSGAFVALALVGVFIHVRDYRWVAAWCGGAAGLCLIAMGGYFGMPGPQGFGWRRAIISLAGVLVLAVIRTPRYVRTVVWLSLALTIVLAIVPNGMASNFGRFIWVCLPVAVAAVGGSPRWRTVVASLVVGSIAAGYTVEDLTFAAHPAAAEDTYTALTAKVKSLPGLDDHRLEVAAHGTHVEADEFLSIAQLVGGWETQSARRYNDILESDSLDATNYRHWLDENAVGYVALRRDPLEPDPEHRLLYRHRPAYLHRIWSDRYWILFRVDNAVPIVDPPARVTRADQATMTVHVPRAGRYALRVHWSRFLTIDQSGAELQSDGGGWTILIASHPGTFVVTA